MNLSMILAIIAAVMFTAFCVLCLYFLKKNREEAERQEKHLKAIENNIYRVGELISKNSEIIEQKPGPTEPMATETVELKVNEADAAEEDFDFEIDLDDLIDEEGPPKQEVQVKPQPVSPPKQEVQPDLQTAKQPAATQPAATQQTTTQPAVDSITELIREIKKVEEKTPQKVKINFDKGKSGRQYSAEELEQLIR